MVSHPYVRSARRVSGQGTVVFSAGFRQSAGASRQEHAPDYADPPLEIRQGRG